LVQGLNAPGRRRGGLYLQLETRQRVQTDEAKEEVFMCYQCVCVQYIKYGH
jgi:hypothetical protein